MKETPETDAHIRDNYRVFGHAIVTHDFARKLERERDEARDELRLIDNEVAFDEAWSDGKTLHEAVGIIISQRDEAVEKLATLERSIADLSHPNIKDVLAQLAQARADDDRNNQIMVELMRQRDELLAALERIRNCKDAPAMDATGEGLLGLHCGVEDRDLYDRYECADYGHTVGVEKALEWASNEASAAIAAVKGEK